MSEKVKKTRRKGREKGEWQKVDTPTILEAIKGTGGIISTISDRLHISRSTFYRYMKDIPEVAEALESEAEAMLDMAESSLFDLIDKGELGAICFYLKCKGKQRGYVEKQEIDASVNQRTTMVVAPEQFSSVEEWEAFIASQQGK